MRSRVSLWCLLLTIALALVAPACSVSERPASTLGAHSKGSIPAARANAIRYALVQAERRVRDLEARLVDKDREISAVKAESDGLREREEETRSDLDALRRAHEAQNAASTHADAASVEGGTAASSPAPSPGGDAEEPVAAPAPDVAQESAAEEAQSGDTGNQVAWLHSQLTSERQQRQLLEAELVHLQEETSAGPFENKLQRSLDDARLEIEQLKATLEIERRARRDLELRYTDLQAQVAAAASPGRNDTAGPRAEEIAALKERQRRAMANIQRDLAASRQREQELREALSQTQGEDAIDLADAVASLHIENAALRVRLDEEHRNNSELSAKLNVATRVTDLIFKMQTRDGHPSPGHGAQSGSAVEGL